MRNCKAYKWPYISLPCCCICVHQKENSQVCMMYMSVLSCQRTNRFHLCNDIQEKRKNGKMVNFVWSKTDIIWLDERESKHSQEMETLLLLLNLPCMMLIFQFKVHPGSLDSFIDQFDVCVCVVCVCVCCVCVCVCVCVFDGQRGLLTN